MTDLTRETVDAVIVGAGAAGSLMAAKLAAAGKQVVVLEAGPRRRLEDLQSSQIWSRRLKGPLNPTIERGEQPVNLRFNSGAGTGGSALHHYGIWPRLHEEDFEMRSRFGRGLDWPISYADLRPYYDRIQEEVGLSGDAEAEIWRPPGAPYPLPPMPVFAQGRAIARGFEKLGLTVAPMPAAILSREYRGRAACIWDGWCDAGCPIGALANPQVTYLAEAERAGAEVRAKSPAVRILVSEDGKRAIGAEYVDPAGERRRQYADLVVVAAFAVETPRLLLASAEGGLANSSGFLGKYIMCHIGGAVFGLFDEETEPHLGVTGGQLLNQDGYAKRRGDGPFGSYQWQIGNALKPNDLGGFANSRPDLVGAEATRFIAHARHHIAKMTAACEGLPLAENRVELNGGKDANGMPTATVTHGAHSDSLALWRHAASQGRDILAAAGASEAWTGPTVTMHILGGAIMGEDAAHSVTDSYGRCHDIPNLVIAGASLFPTIGGVNPTYTIHALTLRAADHLVSQWENIPT